MVARRRLCASSPGSLLVWYCVRLAVEPWKNLCLCCLQALFWDKANMFFVAHLAHHSQPLRTPWPMFKARGTLCTDSSPMLSIVTLALAFALRL